MCTVIVDKGSKPKTILFEDQVDLDSHSSYVFLFYLYTYSINVHL